MLAPGMLLQNRYRILRQIGGGGMGIVYLAEDTRLAGRHCAIKEMSPAQLAPQDRTWAINAFQQEAQMLANLKHPGLTSVTDFFPERGNWYLVMDFVEGETLEQRLGKAPGGRLPLAEALNITRQLCDVLEYLHSQHPPVVFRDLKPGNVMLTPQGEVKLIDFGIARFFKPGQTRDTVSLGTPGYAAPELYGGLGQSDPRADVYSLGALLLQMATGYDPVAAVTPFPLPAPGSLVQGLPPHVEEVISRATQVQPNLRHRSVVKLRQALFPPTSVLSPGTGVTVLPPVQPPTRRLGKRIGVGLGIGAVLLAGLCVVVLVLTVPGILKAIGTPTSVPPTATLPPSASAIGASLTAPTETAAPPPSQPVPIVTPSPSPPHTATVGPSPHRVFVPAGNFTCGSTRADIEAVLTQLCPHYTDSWCRESSFEDELIRPEVRDLQPDVSYRESREVYLDGFYIDRYEVTNAHYATCVEAGACAPPQLAGTNPRHAYFADRRYANYPVVYVTWEDARAYCNWAGARLPTADEWEKAARGTDARPWPWGNWSPTNEANFRHPGQSAANEQDTTLVGGNLAPAGSHPADSSPYGAMDMAGNVMEWVNAWYGPGRREIRGGSWNTGSFALRAASRTGREPGALYFDVGFRCAQDASP
jgi:serine/threonine protein kinase